MLKTTRRTLLLMIENIARDEAENQAVAAIAGEGRKLKPSSKSNTSTKASTKASIKAKAAKIVARRKAIPAVKKAAKTKQAAG